jgi:diadenosine tetraphosphatase ApaH/serine/threonine PP2A family protein phosphatase
LLFGLFGDIHGNLEALQIAVAEMQKAGVDEYLCLGDIVGYGADPEPCVQIVRELGALTIAGNHDHAVIGCLDITFFNQYAREAALWTRSHLSEESQRWLRGLSFVEHCEQFTLVHGSLQAPEIFNYVQHLKDAEYNFRILDRPLLFLGHSHQPLAFFNTTPMTYTLEPTIHVEKEVKSIVNVGSIGQPRDEDPRAAFALYDDATGQIEIRRVEYDVDRAAGKILEAGLPQALALRLTLGK